jgi:hypothetical protein
MKELGLEAKQVAAAIHGGAATDGELAAYYKVQKSGRCSRAYAANLAQALQTTVAALQGERPEEGPTMSQRVEQQLQALLSAGPHPALEKALASMKVHVLIGDAPTRDDRVGYLAEDLAEEIEETQLAPRTGNVERLTQLTGWT